VLAGAGWRLRWLTRTGAGAAVVVGGCVFWGGGVRAGALLFLFVVSSSLLSSRSHDHAGFARDARQVVANGGWAAAGALVLPHQASTGWALLVGALATAQADTWASEIGSHAIHPPRLITTGAVVPRGTSGAVSLPGTAGGALGALVMAGLVLALGLGRRIATAGLAAGVLGMVGDSLLGATVQARYRCRRCDAPAEGAVHCGELAMRAGGFAWLDNDGVNLAATSAGALAAVALSRCC
jgi:uncharacterized protein (TIGR00297 family)